MRSPFVKYAGYGLEQEEEDGSSCDAAGGGSCSAVEGRRRQGGVYWFAEFGARNLHVGGPIQVCTWVNMDPHTGKGRIKG